MALCLDSKRDIFTEAWMEVAARFPYGRSGGRGVAFILRA